MPFPISKYFVNSPSMSSARSSSNLRVTRQPWFGALIAILIVAVVIGGSFALKAFGDSRSESAAPVKRGASSDSSLSIVLTNSSSVTIRTDVTGVRRGDWGYPAPDSAAPNGLSGAWIDPGQSLSVTLTHDGSISEHAPFNLSTTPSAGVSRGGVITLYGQVSVFVTENTSGTDYWSWPTSDVGPSGNCPPAWSGPAGSYEIRGGRPGSITATATCGSSRFTTVITFTDTKS